MAKKWAEMTTDEKLDALRKDIQDIADFVNPIAADVREINSRLSEVVAHVSDLRKKDA